MRLSCAHISLNVFNIKYILVILLNLLYNKLNRNIFVHREIVDMLFYE